MRLTTMYKTFAGALVIFLLNASCAKGPSLTFSGVSLAPEIKTIQIDPFYADVPGGPANLGLLFTETVRDFFIRNTRLALVRGNGDLILSGSIINYDVTPEAPSAGSVESGGTQFSQLAAQQRLTITVKVSYENNYDPDESFEQNFSFFRVFDQNRNLSEVEDELVRNIFEQITTDIFNKTVANW